MDLTPHIYPQKSVSGALWRVHMPNPRLEQMIMQHHDVSAPVASFLLHHFLSDGHASQENLHAIEQFLSPKLRTTMPDPFVMVDMEKLVDVLGDAIQNNQTVGIFGDYDVDGATSTTLMVRYLQALNIQVIWHIPDRKHGYGPNIQALQDLSAQGADIIICVDCGTSAFEVLHTAQQQNMRICVIDHHMAELRLPTAIAIVNPNRFDDSSDLGTLSAVGVCFCVLVALNRHLRTQQFFTHIQQPDLLQWMGLVALGTVCDVVPLRGLNRTFVTQGLKILNATPPVFIHAICQVAGISKAIGVYELGWIIGPYINACGRMEHAKLAVDFLLNDEAPVAGAMAGTLHQYNTDRKQLVDDALNQCHQMVLNGCDYGGFISVTGNFSDGIIGIVAGRLKEHYNKPTLVFAITDTLYKGSGRSVAGIDMGTTFINATQQGILSGGGGHKMAAGCSITPEKYDTFIKYLQSQWTQDCYDKVYTAHAIISPSELHVDMVKDMDILRPYGMGNAEPLYIMENVTITSYKILKDTHIKCNVRASINGKVINVIAFGAMGTELGNCILNSVTTTPVSMLGKLQINVWQDKEQVQFLLQDIAL